MSDHRIITVFEDRYSQQSFTEEQRKELLALEPIWGRQNLILRADDRFLLRKYVGFIATPSLQLQILPKIYADGADIEEINSEKQQAVKMLFRLLQSSGFLKVKEVPDPQSIKAMDGNLLEIYIHIFVKRFLELFQRQIHRQYEQQEDNMVMIKGRILFQQQLLRNGGFKHKHYVSYGEFTEDTLMNRILKTIMISLSKVTKSQENKKKLNIALVYLEDVQVTRLSQTLFKQVRFNRLNEVYRPLFEMAKMFYFNRQPGASAGDERTFTFLVPLNELFEYAVYRWLEKEISQPGLQVLYQRPQAYLDNVNKAFLLKPDITIWDAARKKAVVIIDAKYKNPISESQVDLSESDIYQLLAYAVRYECKQLYLVYPKFRENASRMNPLASYQIQSQTGDIQITPIHVDISAEDINSAKQELFVALNYMRLSGDIQRLPV